MKRQRTESPVEASEGGRDTLSMPESPESDGGAARRVLGVLQRFGTQTAREIERRIRGLDTPAVKGSLAALEKAGAIQGVVVGRKIVYRASDAETSDSGEPQESAELDPFAAAFRNADFDKLWADGEADLNRMRAELDSLTMETLWSKPSK